MEQKTDLRILKTHKALCEAFFHMLEEKRFEDITVNELCERAMVRRATFYKHFADKYEFFGFFIREVKESFYMEEGEKQEEDLSSPHYFVHYFRKSVRFLTEHRKIVDSVLKSSVFPTLLEIFSEEMYRNVLLNMKEVVRAGMPLSVSTEFLASFYTGGIVQILRLWLMAPNGMTEDELVNEVEKMIDAFYKGNKELEEQV